MCTKFEHDLWKIVKITWENV